MNQVILNNVIKFVDAHFSACLLFIQLDLETWLMKHLISFDFIKR